MTGAATSESEELILSLKKKKKGLFRGFINQSLHETAGVHPHIPLPLFF